MKLIVAVFALSFAFLADAQLNAAEPSSEYLPPEVPGEESAQLTQDGYHYKTLRNLKYRARHRRDVSQEYLPPLASEPTQEYLPPVSEKADNTLADDGYRYKAVRKLKFRARHRRDVSEIEQPSKDYLPPVDVELAPDLKTILADDGYRYKTVRRLKYRRHRREADSDDAAPSNEYLPPAEEKTDNGDAVEVKSAELADDGYRYKTVRRIRYRARH